MKKIIAAIIRAIMPKTVKKHEEEEKAKHDYNASTMQKLLNYEHMLKDSVNNRFDTVYTTKKALKTARVSGMSDYNSAEALRNANFR